MTYLLIATCIVLVAFLVYQYVYFTRVYYFNKALNSIKELRLKSTLFITQMLSKEAYSNQEVKEHVDFLHFVNDIVERYDRAKIEMSNFAFAKQIYTQVMFSSDSFEDIKKTEHCESLNEFRVDYTKNLLCLFKAIPFLNIRLLVFFIKLIITLLVHLGFIKLKEKLLLINKFYEVRENISSNCFN